MTMPLSPVHRVLALALPIALALPLGAAAATPPAASETPGSPTGGIVIKGDQEAPLVLYILPWEDSAVSLPPPAPMSDLIPVAVEHERTLLQDYDARRGKDGR